MGCVPRVRTNLCSVTGKTGKERKSYRAGAHAVACTEAPRPVTFSRCMLCRDDDSSRLYVFFVLLLVFGCRGTTALQPSRCRAVASRQPHNDAPLQGNAAAMSSQRWPRHWLGIYGCVMSLANRSFIRRQVTLTLCERFLPPSLRGGTTKQSSEAASLKHCRLPALSRLGPSSLRAIARRDDGRHPGKPHPSNTVVYLFCHT